VLLYQGLAKSYLVLVIGVDIIIIIMPSHYDNTYHSRMSKPEYDTEEN
jgi:hypothetical protein